MINFFYVYFKLLPAKKLWDSDELAKDGRKGMLLGEEWRDNAWGSSREWLSQPVCLHNRVFTQLQIVDVTV